MSVLPASSLHLGLMGTSVRPELLSVPLKSLVKLFVLNYYQSFYFLAILLVGCLRPYRLPKLNLFL